MPRSRMFTRDEITDAALALIREEGMDALTARALGARLGTSAKPVFGVFDSMEQVREAAIQAAGALCGEYMRQDMESGKYPAYKASGMAYIRFAAEEKELFKLLFMRDRSREQPRQGWGDAEPLIRLIQKNTGLPQKEAELLHLEMWIVVHGIATMAASSYEKWDTGLVSDILTDCYEGLKWRFKERTK